MNKHRHHRTIGFAYVTLVVIALGTTPVAAQRSEKRFRITDAGAVADGQTINTKAIQALIDKIAAESGGTVVVPAGTFLTGSIFLKQGVHLLVERDGMLKGSDRLEDYLPPNPAERAQPFALLNADGLSDVQISGEGTIDGNGRRWWDLYWQLRRAGDPDLNFKARRPRLIKISNCKQVLVSGLKLQNQAVWCLHLLFCEDVVAENLTIRAPHDAPSSDGIDIDSSRRVKVIGCDIDVDDDCISIKAGVAPDPARVGRPSEDILIEKTRFGYGHGGADIGSETFGGIRNVEVRDCVAEAGNLAPIRFKTQPGRGGVVENIVFRNFELRDVRQAVEINMQWSSGTGTVQRDTGFVPIFRNIKLINVSGTPNSAGVIRGLAESPIQGISFENCNWTTRNTLRIENAADVDASGLKVILPEGATPIDLRNAATRPAQ